MKEKMTLHDFLTQGYKLEVGDVFEGVSGKEAVVTEDILEVCNEIVPLDYRRYIIKSAALEREAAKESEQGWKVGDECVFANDIGFGVVVGCEKYIGETGKVLSLFTNCNGYEMAAIEFNGGACFCLRVDTLKSETETLVDELDKDLHPDFAVHPEILKAIIKAGYRKVK